MKKILILPTTLLLFAFGMETANALQDSVKVSASPQKEKKHRFLHLPETPRDAAFLEIYNPGQRHLFRKILVFGKFSIEADGFRFIPVNTSPDTYIPQEKFDRLYGYNPLFKELFIPYDDILSVKKNGTVKLKTGKRYSFFSRDYKTNLYKVIESKVKK